MAGLSRINGSWYLAAGVACLGLIGLTAATNVRAGVPDASRLLVNANHTVTGMVTDTAGRAVPDCAVKLLRPSPAKSGPTRRGPNDSPTGDSSIGIPAPEQLQKGGGAAVGKNEEVVKEVKTDASGKFSMPDIAPGHYSLLAGTGKEAVRQDLMVKDADPSPVTLKLVK